MGKPKFNPRNARPSVMALASSARRETLSSSIDHGQTYEVSAKSSDGTTFFGKAYASRIGDGKVIMVGGDGDHKVCRVIAPIEDITVRPNGRDLGGRAQINYFLRGSVEFNAYSPFADKTR